MQILIMKPQVKWDSDSDLYTRWIYERLLLRPRASYIGAYHIMFMVHFAQGTQKNVFLSWGLKELNWQTDFLLRAKFR